MMTILIAILNYGLWASVFAVAKLSLQYSHPIFLTGFRMILGALLMGLLFIRKWPRLEIRLWFSIGLLALFSIYLTNILEFWALQYLSAAKACFIYSFSPFFAAFFSYIYFEEKITPKKLLGLSIGFSGIMPVLLQYEDKSWLSGIEFLSWPALAIIGAALFSVYGWVILRLLVKDKQLSPVIANGASMMIGGLLALIHSFFQEPWNPLPIDGTHYLPFLGWTTLIALVSNVLCYNLYGWLLKRLTATLLSFIGIFSPIFASIHGWLFLREPFSWLILLSTCIVSIGLWIVYSTELKQGYVVTSPSKSF